MNDALGQPIEVGDEVLTVGTSFDRRGKTAALERQKVTKICKKKVRLGGHIYRFPEACVNVTALDRLAEYYEDQAVSEESPTDSEARWFHIGLLAAHIGGVPPLIEHAADDPFDTCISQEHVIAALEKIQTQNLWENG